MRRLLVNLNLLLCLFMLGGAAWTLRAQDEEADDVEVIIDVDEALPDVEDADEGDIIIPDVDEAGGEDTEFDLDTMKGGDKGDTGANVDIEEPAAVEVSADPLVSERNPSAIDTDEIVRRQEKELQAQQSYMEGREAYLRGDFQEAVSNFINAQVKLGDASPTRYLEQQARLDKVLALTYEEWADELAAAADKLVDLAQLDRYEDAIQKYQKVAEINPKRQAEINGKVKRLRQLQRKAEDRGKVLPEVVDPEKASRDREISILIDQGKVYLNNKRYTDAREKFEQVLLKDPYNVAAVRLLRRINEKLREEAEHRRTVMKQERIAEVVWKWSDPVTPLVAPDVSVETGRAVRKPNQDGEGIRAKLDNIIVPKITFEEATIQTVITYLKARSKELDPDNQGVNIFLQLEAAPPQAAPAASGAPGGEFDTGFDEGTGFDSGAGGGDGFDEDFGNFEEFDEEFVAEQPAATGGGGGSIETRTVTMDFDNIPLGEVIRYICQGAGLKYRVEQHAVIIASENVSFDDMETRFYPVEAGFMAKKATRQVNLKFEDDDDDSTTEEVDPLDFFGGLGVEFPEGAKIQYDQKTSKLIVTNTPDQLRKVEQILLELNVSPTQVTIESKFVEISQSDLQELGFEWLLLGDPTGNLGDPTASTTDLVFDGKLKIFKQTATGGEALTRGVRFANDQGLSTINDSLLKIDSIIGGTQYRTVIHALEQSSSADVLSAPKVTTLSGETAVIKMVNERFFPEDWSEPEFQAGSSSGGTTTGASFTPSIPEFGEATEVGVIMEVTPTVASDGYSIDLDLQPEVVQHLGFDDYSYEVTVEGNPLRATLQMPIISRRLIETKVIVWDGETVVLGGMITEAVTTINDKVPFLGDLPLIGRLFQNNATQREKRNLLIFVTARLVNPAGLPIRTQDIRGLPDFRR